MAGQIINTSNDELISEVALQCGDPFFKDFPKNIYSQAVYRAERGIAKEFDILDRKWTYINTEGESPITIAPLNFKSAWRVTVTVNDVETEYKERQLDDILDSESVDDYYYNIIYNANTREFYYTNPATSDTITIYYSSQIAGEEDYEVLDSQGEPNLIPVLPNHLYEEVIRRSVRYISKLGLAQFSGLKAEKYDRILKIHTKRTDEKQDTMLPTDRPWIQIKRYAFPS